MDIRITPLSYLASPGKPNTKINTRYSPNLSPLDNHNYSIRTKSSPATSSNQFLILPKKNRYKSPLVSGVTLNIPQPNRIADKKGVLLYQQVEKNKLLSEQPELVNRFHFRI